PAAPAAAAAPVVALESPVTPVAVKRSDVPDAMRPCFGCHRDIVADYLRHGMAASVGPVGRPEGGSVRQPATGAVYELASDAGGAWLSAKKSDGGIRRQRVVGRIGAGVFDVSWVGEEVDATTGAATGRLFFAPVETVTGLGLVLAPFENHAGSPGMDLALTEQCLDCHTVDRLSGLPTAEATDGVVYPPHALGADAFEHLSPLGCQVCHGDTRPHVELMAGFTEGDADDIGLQRLAKLSPAQQRDTCARCHLQGDARIRIAPAPPTWDRPQAAQWPVLVPQRTVDDFRFVGQVERLALSACFRGSPEMTCTTCHSPHQGVAEQGLASLEAACQGCHGGLEADHAGALTVAQVTGSPARTAAGCVDCHVRRSQPFDLPHVRTADHFIRKHIPKPQDDVPHRQFADPEGPLEIYDDGRLADLLEGEAGSRWRDGVLAMALVSLGRIDEAEALFARFPAPGSPAARRPSAPPDLPALETFAAFHQLRALALQAKGHWPEAIAAYGDAIEVDPPLPSAHIARARLRLLTGDFLGVVEDTQAVINAFPGAETPWDVRADLALRLGRPPMAAQALEKSVERWPSNAVAWLRLGQILAAQGDREAAVDALARAQTLEPSLPGLAEAMQKTGG
ncbi:MAG: tetratricopeptide repeat protein, partial [Acidobacteria bacterium]|nr:tetratricopeptide repeat protein [Acidobacteriota bacterium]